MSGTVPGFLTTPSTCGVLGLLQSGGAFVNTALSDATGLISSLSNAASSLLALPGEVEGIVMGDVSALAGQLSSLAEGAMADFTAHVTAQMAGLVNNLSMAITQASAQAGLLGSGCNLPSMGSTGEGGGLSVCGNMANLFGSIMGAGSALVAAANAQLGNVVNLVAGLVGGSITNIEAALGSLGGLISTISGVGSQIADMVSSETAALAGMLSDVLQFGAVNSLFNLFANPCGAQVLSAVGSPSLLGHLGG